MKFTFSRMTGLAEQAYYNDLIQGCLGWKIISRVFVKRCTLSGRSFNTIRIIFS